MSFAQQFERIFLPRFERRARELQDIMKSEAPSKSGALRDAITIERRGLADYRVGVDSSKLASDPRNVSGVDYSGWVVTGHKAYTIRPVRRKALRWVDDSGVHFAKYVRIPASSGNNFVARAKRRVPKIR